MPITIRYEIVKTLGENALQAIEDGHPTIIDCGDFQVVKFWYRGQECEFYPLTLPVLLRQVETDKEFIDFNQLQEAIDG